MTKIVVLALVLTIMAITSCQALTFSLAEEDVYHLNKLTIKLQAEPESEIPSDDDEVDDPYENNVRQEPGKIFAVLVAGSSGYDNYRHQV